MRRFENIDHAIAYADIGGQSLFPTGWIETMGKRKDTAAHLFDANVDRLTKTGAELNGGVETLPAVQWRPGVPVFYIPISEHAVTNAVELCHTRIVRKTVERGDDDDDA